MTLDRPVDTTAALYAHAGERAFRKWPHHGPAGSLQLDYQGNPVCGGQLRTAYVRRVKAATYPRKTEWVPVGVICEGCGAWWAKPPAEAAA